MLVRDDTAASSSTSLAASRDSDQLVEEQKRAGSRLEEVGSNETLNRTLGCLSRAPQTRSYAHLGGRGD